MAKTSAKQTTINPGAADAALCAAKKLGHAMRSRWGRSGNAGVYDYCDDCQADLFVNLETGQATGQATEGRCPGAAGAELARQAGRDARQKDHENSQASARLAGEAEHRSRQAGADKYRAKAYADMELAAEDRARRHAEAQAPGLVAALENARRQADALGQAVNEARALRQEVASLRQAVEDTRARLLGQAVPGT